MVAEIVGGVLSNSLAIATDAAHLLTDFASFMISLFAIWLAGRPRSEKMSFGWHRAEVLGAILSVLMIWVVTGILVYMAVLIVISQEFEIDSEVMLITSGFLNENIFIVFWARFQGVNGLRSRDPILPTRTRRRKRSPFQSVRSKI